VIQGEYAYLNLGLILNGYRDRVVWVYKYKSIVNGNKGEVPYWYLCCNFNFICQWKIWYTEDTFLQSKINIKKSYRRSQCTWQLVCEDGVIFVWVDLHVSFCRQQHTNCLPAIRLVYPFFCELYTSSKPTNKPLTQTYRFKQYYLGKHSELNTCQYELVFSQWTVHLQKYWRYSLNHFVKLCFFRFFSKFHSA
jgi:hypothetical protein